MSAQRRHYDAAVLNVT